jgi:hypothetical protein
VALVTGIVDPGVVYGTLAVTPPPVACIPGTTIPALIFGSVSVTPAPVSLRCSNGGPIALTITLTDIAELVCAVAGPTIEIDRVLSIYVEHITFGNGA